MESKLAIANAPMSSGRARTHVSACSQVLFVMEQPAKELARLRIRIPRYRSELEEWVASSLCGVILEGVIDADPELHEDADGWPKVSSE